MSSKRHVPPDIAIIIPSYNPDDRLYGTVRALSERGAEHIIVVDDGSIPAYQRLFSEIASLRGCEILHHAENRGKGAALKTGMEHCLNAYPTLRGVVTVDGDGHHRVLDVISCAQKMKSSGQVVLGQRGRRDKTLSKRGHFGNRLTSFAISMVCDFDIPDPLSGLRGIPTRYLPLFLNTKGDAYDFETNMILDMKRHDVPFRTFSMAGEYFADGSKSHYRPLRDSVKITVELLRFFTQQFKYLGSSLGCYAVEYLLFHLLLVYLPVLGVTLSNYICRLFSGTANFLINKNIVFGVKKNNGATVLRYVALILFVMLTSTQLIVIVNLIFHTEANTAAKFIKIPVDVFMFFVGYYLQKKWVFKKK